MRNNFRPTFFTLVCFMLLCSVTAVAQQDSIPNVKPNTQTITPPSEVGQDLSPVVANPTNNNNTNSTEAEVPNTAFPTNLPKRTLFVEKPDPELIAAMSNNPFALIRDGKPKTSKHQKEILPTSPAKSKKEAAKEKTAEVEIIEEEEEEKVVKEVFIPVDTSTTALNQQNPFRLEGTLKDRKTGIAAKKIKFNPKAGSGTKKTTSNRFVPIFDTSKVDVNPLSTLKFSLSILLLGFLAIIITRFRSEVNDTYKAFLNQNLMSLLHREKGTFIKLPYLLLYALTTLSVGTMLFLSSNFLGVKIFDSNITSLIVCIAGAGSIYLGRHLILYLLSYIFPFKKEINFYSFTIAIFNFMIGIILLPFIIFIAFAPSNAHTVLLYAALFSISIIYLFRIIRMLLITNKYLIHNKFHFFMYLCTVEIAPILILLKLVGL